MALQIGQFAPDICLDSHLGRPIRISDYRKKKNIVLAFFPLAWTPVWTSQIPSYQAALDRFEGVQTQVLGLSVDSVPSLTAWAESLGGITYPLLSDFYPHGEASKTYGVLRPDGTSERAIFVIDKYGIIRYIDVHDIDDQPDNEVLFGVLDELEPQAAALYKSRQADNPATVESKGQTLVKLFCTPWCPGCRRARAYLRDHGIPFEEINIIRDRDSARLVRSWANGNETTPTFQIGDKVIVDFKKAELDEILGIEE